MTALHLAISSTVVGILYLALADRMRAFGSRFRSEAAALGVDLLDDECVPPNLKHTIEGLLTNVPRTRIAWLFAACAIPATISLLLRKNETTAVSANAPYFLKWDQFTDAVILASLCNSPAAAILCALELAAMSFLVSAQMIVDLMAEHIGKSADNGSFNRGATATSR